MLGDLKKKRILVNIQTYGDFDIPGTDTIMMAPHGYDRSGVSKLAKTLRKQNSETRNTDAVIKELKSLGFEILTSVDLTIGDEL